MADRDTLPLPLEVRARLAELELELSEGDITQKGYEKKRSKLIGAYLPQLPGVEPSLSQERRPPITPSSSSRYHRRRSSGSRDERYRSDVHTEAVQAALAKQKERKMAVPMPSKRRSLVVQTSMDAYTPPGEEHVPIQDTSSGSEGEGSMQGEGTPTSSQGSINMEHWISRAIHGSTTSSTTSSSSTHSGGSGAASRLADVMGQTHIGGSENHSAPPDVTTYTSEHSVPGERPQVSTTSRTTPKYGNAELMETGDGVPVSSRVSAKIQQLTRPASADNFLASRPAELFLQEVYGLNLGRSRPDPPGPAQPLSRPHGPGRVSVNLVEQVRRLGFAKVLQGAESDGLRRQDSATFLATGGGSLLDGLRRNQSLPAMVGGGRGPSICSPSHPAPPLHPTALSLPIPSWGSLKDRSSAPTSSASPSQVQLPPHKV